MKKIVGTVLGFSVKGLPQEVTRFKENLRDAIAKKADITSKEVMIFLQEDQLPPEEGGIYCKVNSFGLLHGGSRQLLKIHIEALLEGATKMHRDNFIIDVR